MTEPRISRDQIAFRAIAAVKAVYNRLFGEGGTFFDVEDMAAVREEVEELTGLPDHYKVEEASCKK